MAALLVDTLGVECCCPDTGWDCDPCGQNFATTVRFLLPSPFGISPVEFSTTVHRRETAIAPFPDPIPGQTCIADNRQDACAGPGTHICDFIMVGDELPQAALCPYVLVTLQAGGSWGMSFGGSMFVGFQQWSRVLVAGEAFGCPEGAGPSNDHVANSLRCSDNVVVQTQLWRELEFEIFPI